MSKFPFSKRNLRLPRSDWAAASLGLLSFQEGWNSPLLDLWKTGADDGMAGRKEGSKIFERSTQDLLVGISQNLHHINADDSRFLIIIFI